VFAAFVLLTTLIAATPLVALADGPAIQGIVAALSALAVAMTVRSIPPGESRYLSKVISPVMICLAVPAIWMAIQAAPMPLRGLVHPIWASAEAALGKPLMGSISVDPGTTLVAITRYLTVVGIVLAAAGVTIDRRRAEMVLFWLAGATVLGGVMLIMHGLANFSFVDESRDREAARSLMAGCVIGVPLSAAACGHMLERYERRRTNPAMSLVGFGLIFAGCLGGLAICFAALAYAGTTQLLLIAVCGLAIIVAVVIVRRAGVGGWFSLASVATAVVIIAALLSLRSGGNADLTLRFADAPARMIAITESLIADTPWSGSGAGTFAALLPIYRDVNDVAEGASAPTAAAEIAVELGKPALWAIVAMTILAVAFLLHGALTRGRDSFYAAAVTSSIVVFALQAFGGASVFATSVVVLASAAFGLGIAQSLSRSLK